MTSQLHRKQTNQTSSPPTLRRWEHDLSAKPAKFTVRSQAWFKVRSEFKANITRASPIGYGFKREDLKNSSRSCSVFSAPSVFTPLPPA
jgi:hypothetical protein